VERPDTNRATVKRRTHWGRRFVATSIVVGGVALCAGFLRYAAQFPENEGSFDQKADGIVALTGGPDRINDAVELLAAGRGKRLLITGVNPTTRMEELARLMPRYEAMFNCCIDLDRSALNTIGNAVETRRWAVERGFKSLIVVTSRFHMARALAELEHQLPEVALIPYPVVSDKQRAEPWWTSFPAARALAFEYLKYLVAAVRMKFDWIVAMRDTTSSRSRA
jgi:uncharacterized SAM-binding protein YcdF (DUF218 family)